MDQANQMPASLHNWWRQLNGEVYWLEVTDRSDPGANLKAPQRNETGGGFWSYSLVREVQRTDVVFHYDKPSQRIIAWSRATGDLWDDQVVWAARGTYAREAGIIPHLRNGWYAGLEGFQPLARPLDLSEIRAKTETIRAQSEQLAASVGSPLYFPFESGEKRPLRPLQGYLFKLPRFFVELFDELRASTGGEQPVKSLMVREVVGSDYRRADEDASVGAHDPMEVDPAIVERGTRGHAITQNALADHVVSLGLQPRSPSPDEPNFDLAWECGNEVLVAEVKSVTNKNEERQLRMGLGQVLRYRHQLEALLGKPVVAVLVSERKPPAGWLPLCDSLGVRLAWPGRFDAL